MSVLSSDLISQFVKATNDTTSDSSSTSIAWGTVSAANEESGTFKVILDGSSIPISVSTTVTLNVGDRVQVTLYNHTAIVTGNSTSISVDYDSISADFASFTYLTANYASIDYLTSNYINTETLEATYASIKYLTSNYINTETLEATYATIDYLTSNYINTETLEATYATIDYLTSNYITTETLKATYASIEYLSSTYATLENLSTTNATISNLSSTYVTIDFANITDASIDKLTTYEAFVSYLISNYADISFTNIDTATIDTEFVTGLLTSANILSSTVQADTATITGYLTSVGLNANYLVAGTLDCSTITVANLTVGTLIVDSINGYSIAGYTSTASTLDDLLEDLAAGITDVWSISNGKSTTYYDTDEPNGDDLCENDIWFDTDDGYAMYMYSGSEWVKCEYGTSALSAKCITSDLIAASAITAGKIASDAVTANCIEANSITANCLAVGTITGEYISGETITGDLIAGETITGDHIIANGITATNIASSAVTTDKLAANAVTAAKIEAGTITSTEIDAGSISAAILVADCITSDMITVDAVEADHINVDDLYAIGATIGGFDLVSSAIYCNSKSNINSTLLGIYLGSDGQFSIGDAYSYIKFYLDSSSGEYKLDISASEFTYSSCETVTSLLGNYVSYSDYGDVFYDYCVNGDFSDGLNSWSVSSNNYVFLSSYDNTTCVEFTAIGYYLRQKVSLSEDGIVIVRFNAACESGYEDSMRVKVLCSGGTLYSDVGEISTEWTELTFAFNMTAGSNYYFYIYEYGVNASLYITDIEILGPYTKTLATTTAELKVTMDEISTSVSNVEGDVSTLTQTAEGLEATIGSVKSNIRTYFAADDSTVIVETGTITFNSNTIIINSDCFSVTATGVITATSGTIGGFTIEDDELYSGKTSYTDTTNSGIYLGSNGKFMMGGSSYYIQFNGSALNVVGVLSTVNGNYKTKLVSGCTYYYYDDDQIGLIGCTHNSKDTSEIGLAVHLEYDCGFMAFGRKMSSSASSYTSFMSYDYNGSFSGYADTLNFEATVSAPYFVKMGRHTYSSPSAGTVYSTSFTFSTTFPGTPVVVCSTNGSDNPHLVHATATDVSSTGFTLNYMRESGTSSIIVYWIAMYVPYVISTSG